MVYLEAFTLLRNLYDNNFTTTMRLLGYAAFSARSGNQWMEIEHLWLGIVR